MIGFVTWRPFCSKIIIKVAKWQSQSWKICYKLLYFIQGVKSFFFLASADIKAFGHTCLLACCFWLALHFFYTPGVFVYIIIKQP